MAAVCISSSLEQKSRWLIEERFASIPAHFVSMVRTNVTDAYLPVIAGHAALLISYWKCHMLVIRLQLS
jgi:hypothetical protein